MSVCMYRYRMYIYTHIQKLPFARKRQPCCTWSSVAELGHQLPRPAAARRGLPSGLPNPILRKLNQRQLSGPQLRRIEHVGVDLGVSGQPDIQLQVGLSRAVGALVILPLDLQEELSMRKQRAEAMRTTLFSTLLRTTRCRTAACSAWIHQSTSPRPPWILF